MYVLLQPVNKPIRVRYEGAETQIPNELKVQIEWFWEQAMKQNNRLFRGNLFVVDERKESIEEIQISTKRIDYAYYLFAKSHPELGSLPRSISTGAILETTDRYWLIGEMSSQTSKPGVLQIPGGAIDLQDLRGTEFSLVSAMKREIREEIGLDLAKEAVCLACEPAYVRTQGNYGVLYRVKINLTAEDVQKEFAEHVEKLIKSDEEVEFSSLTFVKKDFYEIKKFLEEDQREKSSYLEELLLREIQSQIT